LNVIIAPGEADLRINKQLVGQTMLLVGTQTNDAKRPIRIGFDGLLHHTLVVGQSGSGKSFFVARLLEEILLRSRARVLIIDPNGDFRKLSSPNDSIWNTQKSRFEELQHLDKTAFENVKDFKNGWAKRRFTYLNPALLSPSTTNNEVHRRLVVHWESLEDELRRFLLSADPSREPKTAVGIETLVRSAELMETTIGFDLRSLQQICEEYALRNRGLRAYEPAKTLTTDDWYAVRAKVFDVLSSYTIWWSRSPEDVSPRPPGLSEFVDGSFDQDRAAETYWDALVLSLDSANQADALLTVEVALSRLWTRTKAAWRERADQPPGNNGGPDKRVPTFIIVDEAHNFAPEQSSNPLRERLTSRLMQIASEGRKYGLYLVLATQRPTKLHKELVSECENSCLLRVQSDRETNFACEVLGYSTQYVAAVKGFTQGQGLFNGRWMDGPVQIDAKIAPARTVVGGGGLGEDWKNVPDETPEIADPVAAISQFVEATLKASSTAIPLVQLAETLYDEFDIPRDGKWLGRGGLKALLTEAKVPNLEFLNEPPGYAFLSDVHKTPDKSSSYFAPLTEHIAPDALEAVMVAHNSLGLPLLSSDQFRFVLEGISNAVRNSEFDLNFVSKAVRDDARRQHKNIGRNAVIFVLRALQSAGHRFDPDLPQTSEVLAEALCKSVIEGLRRIERAPDPAMAKALRVHLSGGLLTISPSEPATDLTPAAV
jgi:Helicase HerA, central domain